MQRYYLALGVFGLLSSSLLLAEPPGGGACRDFVETQCAGQNPPECLSASQASLSPECLSEYLSLKSAIESGQLPAPGESPPDRMPRGPRAPSAKPDGPPDDVPGFPPPGGPGRGRPRPVGMGTEFLYDCGGALSTCESKTDGSERLQCLADNGSDACKARVAEFQDRMNRREAVDSESP